MSTGLRFHMITGATKPVAPFCHASEADGWVFLTGQMPDTPEAPGVLPGSIEEQTVNVMENLRTILEGLKLGLQDVAMVRIYLRHFEDDYAAMNAVYRRFFPDGKLPARTCIGVTGLAYGARIEIAMTARRPG